LGGLFSTFRNNAHTYPDAADWKFLVSLLYVFGVVAEGKWWWPVVMAAG